MTDPGTLVIGTRASPLAMAQAHETEGALRTAHGWEPDRIRLSPMTSTGDLILNRPLAEAGGKGLFTKELDEALLARTVDLAVHSAKDLPTVLPPGLVIAGFLPREDVRDVLVSQDGVDITGLPQGAVVGSASARRGAILLRARPDLSLTLIRGNVGTRLAKVGRGEVVATVLALAGLRRLGFAEEPGFRVLSPEEMLPAVGQGAIALVIRAGDARVAEAVAPICHVETGASLAAERAYLGVLDGSCRTPIAGHAVGRDGTLAFRGMVLTLDGADARDIDLSGAPADAERLGREAGQAMRAKLPAGWLAA